MKIAFVPEVGLSDMISDNMKATNLTVNFEEGDGEFRHRIFNRFERFDCHELVGDNKWNADFSMIPLKEALIFKTDNGLKALIPYVSGALISRYYVHYRNMDHTPFTGLSTDLLGWQHFLNVKILYQIEAMKG